MHRFWRPTKITRPAVVDRTASYGALDIDSLMSFLFSKKAVPALSCFKACKIEIRTTIRYEPCKIVQHLQKLSKKAFSQRKIQFSHFSCQALTQLDPRKLVSRFFEGGTVHGPTGFLQETGAVKKGGTAMSQCSRGGLKR